MAKRPIKVWNGSSWDDVSGPTPNSEVIKFDTGSTEGTDLYTFDGTVAKTIDIKAGTNVTLTKTSGSITIAASGSGGGVVLGTATPLANGVAAAGNSASASHENHVHPSDTTKANTGTTAGTNLLNLTNPSALSYPRINADNTVTAVPVYSTLATLYGFTNTATAGGTTTLTVASTPMQQFSGTEGHTIRLPVTSTLTQGHNFWIDNNSTQNIIVESSGENAVITVQPSTTAILTCILTSGTTAASWDSSICEFNTVTGTGGVAVMATSPSFVTSVIGGATMAVFNTTSTTINAFGAATTANIGGTPTGAITANIFNNATASGSTKAVNIGTSGAAGSTTNITIGSTTGTSTVTIHGKLVTEEYMVIALSDEATAITTGTAKFTMRAPFAMTLTSIPRAYLSTASSSGNPTVDINEGGTSVLGANKLSIDANEKTSTTATTATTLADTAIADDAEITFDIDTAGTGAKGLKVALYYKRT